MLSYFSIFGRWVRLENGRDVLKGKLYEDQVEIDLWKVRKESSVFNIGQPRTEFGFDDPHVCGGAAVIHLPEEDCNAFHVARTCLIVGLILLTLGTITSAPIIFSPSGLHRASTHLSAKAVLIQKTLALLTAALAFLAIMCMVVVVIGVARQVLNDFQKPWIRELLKIDEALSHGVHQTLQEGLICTVLQLVCSIFAMVLALKYWCWLKTLSIDYRESERESEDKAKLEMAAGAARSDTDEPLLTVETPLATDVPP